MIAFGLWILSLVFATLYVYTSSKMQLAHMFSNSPRRYQQALKGKSSARAFLALGCLIFSLIIFFIEYRWWSAAFLAGWVIWIQILFWILPKLIDRMMVSYWRQRDQPTENQ